MTFLSISRVSVLPRDIGAFFTGGNSEAQAISDTIAADERAMLLERGEKLPKSAAGYVLVPPLPPIVWVYDCQNCRFWQVPDRCEIVGLPDDQPGGETIAPTAYCALWLPYENDEAFSWIGRRGQPAPQD